MSSRAKPEKSQSESVRLPANFLSVLFALRLPFCLPFFLSRLQKILCFQWLQSCFCLPFCLPVRSFASILESYGAQSQNQVQNLFFAGCLLVVLLVVYKTASSPNLYSARLSARVLLVNLLVARWSFCWSVVCCLFVIPFVGHSFCHAKYPIRVTNLLPCGSYGARSCHQSQILFAQIRPYFALYVIFIFTPIFIAHCLYL